jgi:hypothetical protein
MWKHFLWFLLGLFTLTALTSLLTPFAAWSAIPGYLICVFFLTLFSIVEKLDRLLQ